MTERLEAVISGRVQMVMFRDFAAREARRLGLVGEVQNLPDGTVQVIAEGKRVSLEALLEKLRKGPILAHVKDVHTAWLSSSDLYSTFVITYE